MSNTPQKEWLPLSEASQRLGVHPATLRRWADLGLIPYMLTPGGHRRFAPPDIEAFKRQRRHVPPGANIEQLWAERALIQTRQELATQHNSPWMQAIDEEHREQERALGRRLMGVVLHYVSAQANAEGLISEARVIGREYGLNAIAMGLPIVTSLQVAMFFRDTMIEVAMQLPQTTDLPLETSTNLLRRINTVLNAVQLAIVQTYEDVEKP